VRTGATLSDGTTQRLESARERLARLRADDGRRRVFGAQTHGYVSSRLPERQLSELEDALGVPLPDDYRLFLARIGYGAGPYYGLWSPQEILDELAGETRDDVFRTAEPFPFSAGDAERAPVLDAPYPCPGAIPICHHGCTYYSFLVVCGPLTGSVWDVVSLRDAPGEHTPAAAPLGVQGSTGPRVNLPRPPRFLDWYGAWLDRSLRDLSLPAPEHLPAPKTLWQRLFE
jgi:hypothetical protein